MAGGRGLIKAHKFIDAQAITASFNSSAINLDFLDNVAIQLNVTTTGNNGLFTIEVSNDNANWSTVTLTPPIAALASSNTVISVSLVDLAWTWLRVKFTEGVTKTNGTVTGYITAKGK